MAVMIITLSFAYQTKTEARELTSKESPRRKSEEGDKKAKGFETYRGENSHLKVFEEEVHQL